MFYKFNAHKASKPAQNTGDKVANRIFERLISAQRRWAAYMGAKAQRLGLRRLKVVLIIAVTLSAGYCASLIFAGIVSSLMPGAKADKGSNILVDSYRAYHNKQRESRMHVYLDSLEKAVVQDSLDQLKQNKK